MSFNIHVYDVIRQSRKAAFTLLCCVKHYKHRGGSRFFVRRGCTRLLLYFNTNKPQNSFFLQNTSCIRKPQGISGGVRTPCTLPLDPPLKLTLKQGLLNRMPFLESSLTASKHFQL